MSVVRLVHHVPISVLVNRVAENTGEQRVPTRVQIRVNCVHLIRRVRLA